MLAEERQLELEAEVRSLKAAVVDAQTNAEQLEEMSRCGGNGAGEGGRGTRLMLGVGYGIGCFDMLYLKI